MVFVKGNINGYNHIRLLLKKNSLFLHITIFTEQNVKKRRWVHMRKTHFNDSECITTDELYTYIQNTPTLPLFKDRLKEYFLDQYSPDTVPHI